MAKIEETAKNSFWLAILLTVAMYVVSWAFTKIGLAPTTLFSSFPTPVNPVSSTVGVKIMQMIGGIIPFTFELPSIAMMIISAFAVIFVGNLVVGYMPSLILAGRTRYAKVTWVVIWGAAIFYLIIVGAKWISFNQAIGLFIYTVPASMLAVKFGEWFNLTGKY